MNSSGKAMGRESERICGKCFQLRAEECKDLGCRKDRHKDTNGVREAGGEGQRGDWGRIV